MAISNLPTWQEGEISSAGKLNQLRDAIETKFLGAIAGGDISWPLIAQGNLDMSGFSILAVKRFWNTINADEYTSLQAAIDVAEAAGGGVVFIPPSTEFEVDGQTIEASNVTILGAGPTSVLKLTSGASSGQLLSTSAGLSDLSIINCTIDGNSGTGTSQNGLVFKQATNVLVSNVIFKDFSGTALYVTNDGTNGNSSTDVVVANCQFSGGTGDHFVADDVDGLVLMNCKSDTSGAAGFQAAPAAAASMIKNVQFLACDVRNSTNEGLRIVGSAATASANQWDCHLIGCRVNTTTGTTKNGIVLGESTAVLDRSSVIGCRAYSATGNGIIVNGDRIQINDNKSIGNAQDGFSIQVNEGTFNGNFATDNTGAGIDFNTSDQLCFDCNISVDNGGFQWTGFETNSRGGLSNIGHETVSDFTVDSAAAVSLDGTVTINSGGAVNMVATDPQDRITVKQGGCPFPVREKATVTQSGGATQALIVVPSGEIWLVRRCILRTTTAWDGTGFDLDIGIAGGDTDGFYDGSTAGFAGTGVEAADPADQGLLLFNTDATNYVIDATGGAVTIQATVTAGTGSVGSTKVFIEFIVLKGNGESV